MILTQLARPVQGVVAAMSVRICTTGHVIVIMQHFMCMMTIMLWRTMAVNTNIGSDGNYHNKLRLYILATQDIEDNQIKPFQCIFSRPHVYQYFAKC